MMSQSLDFRVGRVGGLSFMASTTQLWKPKDDLSNIEAYAAQLGWYQMFQKKNRNSDKLLGWDMHVLSIFHLKLS